MKYVYDKKTRKVVAKPEPLPPVIEILSVPADIAKQLEALQTMRRSWERAFGKQEPTND